jgi:cytochrome c-type biogenesis protein CcmH
VSRRSIAWVALAVVVAATVAWVAWPRGGHRSTSARVRDLGSELRCPDCEGQSIAQSSTPTARAARADIRRRVAEGQSDGQIRQAFVDKYGESILLKPEGGGLGVLVWGLPAAVILLGAAALVFALRRWQRESHLHPTDADRVLVEKARS